VLWQLIELISILTYQINTAKNNIQTAELHTKYDGLAFNNINSCRHLEPSCSNLEI
jgi:hypothetical protein